MVAEKHRKPCRAPYLLLEAFFDKLLKLAHRRFYITEVIADAVTDDGVELAKALGMEAVKESGHATPIYRSVFLPPSASPNKITMKKFADLWKHYKQQYVTFKRQLDGSHEMSIGDEATIILPREIVQLVAGGPYDVFISYRRRESQEFAEALRKGLEHASLSVFLDRASIVAGRFDEQIRQALMNAHNVVLILSPGALDDCHHEGDWLRMEIALALDGRKNILPLFMEEFDKAAGFRSLPADIAELQHYNGINVLRDHVDVAVAGVLQQLRPAPG